MSDKKKDLTRIEDLGEFLHELGDDIQDGSDFTSEESSDASDFSENTSSFESVETPVALESFESDSFEEDPFKETNSFEEDASTHFEESEPTSLPDFPEDNFTSNSETFNSDNSSFLNDNDFSANSIEEHTPFESAPSVSDIIESPINKNELPIESYKSPETFSDLKKFADNSSFSGMGAEGNPSFSVLIKNIRYLEDVNDIMALLKELKLATEPDDQLKDRLMRGSLLVSRISEYAAIFLAHKLRRFDIDIQVGLSDEIHPPRHQESPETGIVSKYNLYQNQSHHFHFNDPKLELSQIIVATAPSLEGHQILRYIGVASEHKLLDGNILEDDESNEIPHHYTELAHKLKAHALKSHANAVIGLNFQITPLPSEFGSSGNKYRLTCTGNLVWVTRL